MSDEQMSQPDAMQPENRHPAAWTLAPKRRNFLGRLWHGEVSLGVTYWVFGALVGNLIAFLFYSLAADQTELPEALASASPAIVYSVFICVAIVRSARRYRARHPTKRGRILAGLAQVLAVMGTLSTISRIPNLVPGMSDADMETAVRQANKGGPHMVEDGVRFEKASRAGRDFIYDYTLTNLAAAQLPPTAKDLVFAKVQKGVCADATSKRMLASFNKVTYRYQDKNGQPAVMVDLTKTDCP